MSISTWQRKKQAAKRRSMNQHAAKARKRMAQPIRARSVGRLKGRRYNILINEPWRGGNNTRFVVVDFAPRPHRRDRIVYNGVVMSMSEFIRSEVPKLFPPIQEHCE